MSSSLSLAMQKKFFMTGKMAMCNGQAAAGLVIGLAVERHSFAPHPAGEGKPTKQESIW